MLTDREGGPGGGVFIKFHIAKHKLVLGHRYSLLLMVFDPPPHPPATHFSTVPFWPDFLFFIMFLTGRKGKNQNNNGNYDNLIFKIEFELKLQWISHLQ